MAHPLLRDLWNTLKREPSRLSMQDYVSYFNYNGVTYPFVPSGTIGEKQEPPEPTFEGYTAGLYKSNAVVFACMTVRAFLFAEARFQYQQMRGGRPGDFFGSPALSVLENPWPNGTTRDLLARAIQDADISGNFYGWRNGATIKRLRPDWVTIVLGSQMDPEDAGSAADAEVIGYIYQPGGYHRSEPVPLLVEEVCHFAPNPDPTARFRGMSWLTPVVREVMGDNAATQHKLTFFEKGATPNMVATLDPQFTPQQVQTYAESFRQQHAEVANAYRTIFLGGGAKLDVVGANLQEIDFKVTQGGGETRIAAAAGVPPVIAGLSEGLAAATYSNYQQSIRRLVDLTMVPLWGKAADCFSSVVDVPLGSRLWYDPRDIPALAEDQKDLAEIKASQAQQIKTLVDAGFDADSVVAAVTSSDYQRLVHTGLFSVQLQPPGTQQPQPDPTQNGSGELPIGAGT